ncbi:phosphatase PAP2 family protein [Ilumatobacter coccineus]|jgi:PAP2 superfamily|uniref:Inositolphosphotransferase Aur1/Ipt1 domain-containing protein n=1 Tax=Ilumatobacter coccineus (strain NBRC 103263 / KCTC 29153 / YM16-304) TaxID=1313172 RepID=A0A6C7E426_ILUCY|nr:phosphatase PAP2 family protein [Ilumatobacter coccineus]BAN01401.1 hypothetical protein YM304_10870 [Ilumatobacter coccineus YM16-304]
MEGSTTVPARQHRLHWWKEALIVAAFYVVYSWIRNQFGSNTIAADGVPEAAFHNAELVIRFERAVGLYHEESIQELFLSHRWFIQFWNVYYGTAHFFVTLAVFILLFFKRADVFPQWRNTLAAMTALAIVGFAFFPLMPPRLLDAPCPIATAPPEDPNDILEGNASPVVHEGARNTDYGGACVPSDLRPGKDRTFNGSNGFGFVDTVKRDGGPWAFDSEEVAAISNQYAAMPSMHIGWSTWCAIAVWPLLRRRRYKALVLLYPAFTLFCIIVTANHFWLDGIGGLIAFGLGSIIGWGIHRWNQNRLDRKHGIVPTDDMKLSSVASEIFDDVSGHDDRDDMHDVMADATLDDPPDEDHGDVTRTAPEAT